MESRNSFSKNHLTVEKITESYQSHLSITAMNYLTGIRKSKYIPKAFKE